jgi:hypothetical protein
MKIHGPSYKKNTYILFSSLINTLLKHMYILFGFGDPVVSMLASGTQVREPSDFSGEKILSMPSIGGEVKPSVPCRSFATR